MSVFASCSSSSMEMATGRHLPEATPYGGSSLAETGEPVTTRCLCKSGPHAPLCGYPNRTMPLMQKPQQVCAPVAIPVMFVLAADSDDHVGCIFC